MSDPISHSPDLPARPQLTDRVIARVQGAHTGRLQHTETDIGALRRVFLDFGDSYRNYRRRTGQAVSPEVRNAARRFRRDLDLVSLVGVAKTLEQLDGDLVS